MTTSLRNVKIASRGMGLEDCVASQEGYLRRRACTGILSEKPSAEPVPKMRALVVLNG
jgi:hypothetical protein